MLWTMFRELIESIRDATESSQSGGSRERVPDAGIASGGSMPGGKKVFRDAANTARRRTGQKIARTGGDEFNVGKPTGAKKEPRRQRFARGMLGGGYVAHPLSRRKEAFLKRKAEKEATAKKTAQKASDANTSKNTSKKNAEIIRAIGWRARPWKTK